MDHEPDDLTALMQRRRALKLLAGAGVGLGLVALGACGSDGDSNASGTTSTTSGSSSSSSSSSPSTTSGSTSDVEEIPEETAGPFPGDGSNGPNVLTEDGVVRSDITSSFGSSSGTAEGVPLTVQLSIVDVANGGAPLAGAAVYIWHCTREGGYSMYSDGVADQNFLRGVQETGSDGTVTFQSIYPGAYSGRWPHIHFEVYPNLDEATAAGDPSATSQIALPEDISAQVYATDGYEQSVTNLDQSSLTSDMVFSDDGAVDQLATMSGSIDSGLTAQLTVGV